MTQFLTSLHDLITGPLNIILTLIALFQYLDRRNRTKYLENSLWAVHQISARMKAARLKDDLIQQKADDICDSLSGIMRSVDGDGPWVKPERELRKK